ncbi:MAG: putative N-acyltransferase [Phenylobacterium sp.]|jgi:predicted N-acyltransferase
MKTSNTPTQSQQYDARFIASIHEIEAEQWQALFDEDYPFTRHEFLATLEDSDCTNGKTGWLTQHLLIYCDDVLVAAMPCYIKTHSYGEYIFDWSWADAYHKHGIEYYPKIVCAIPYTPATGARLGLHSEFAAQTPAIILCVNAALAHLAQKIGASNWQCLFPEKTFSDQLTAHSWLQRIDTQFHWFNRDYQHFDDFLCQFNSRKRKNVVKERRQVSNSDVTLAVVEGADITPAIWQRFYLFYQLTYQKRSRNMGYLNQAFFESLSQVLPQQVMMVVARNQNEEKDENGEIVAAALYFKSADTLYGRYWGCLEEQQFLHFECCYYQGIEYCIKHQLSRFDAGAQGEHKIQRGFEPVTTYANYHVLHPQFGPAIANFLQEEKAHIEQYMVAARGKLPFKK